ncbi:hypothetical protein D9M71_834670 [compost metagenome]
MVPMLPQVKVWLREPSLSVGARLAQPARERMLMMSEAEMIFFIVESFTATG